MKEYTEPDAWDPNEHGVVIWRLVMTVLKMERKEWLYSMAGASKKRTLLKD